MSFLQMLAYLVIPPVLNYLLVLILRLFQARGKTPNASGGAPSRNKVQVCKDLIAGRVTPDGRPNQLSPLESKAIPNSWLVPAFNVNNAFVTMDNIHANRFVKSAREYMADVDWQILASTVDVHIQSFLQSHGQVGVPLAELMFS